MILDIVYLSGLALPPDKHGQPISGLLTSLFTAGWRGRILTQEPVGFIQTVECCYLQRGNWKRKERGKTKLVLASADDGGSTEDHARSGHFTIAGLLALWTQVKRFRSVFIQASVPMF